MQGRDRDARLQRLLGIGDTGPLDLSTLSFDDAEDVESFTALAAAVDEAVRARGETEVRGLDLE